MKPLYFMLVLFSLPLACKKKTPDSVSTPCDIYTTYQNNSSKVTINQGIWGTVSMIEGNCFPVINPEICKHCPVRRIVRIYEYTVSGDATPAGNSTFFYTNFNTNLISSVIADDEGFYEVTLPAGRYTIAVVENGLLYAPSKDTNGGINTITLVNEVKRINLTMIYKASF